MIEYNIKWDVPKGCEFGPTSIKNVYGSEAARDEQASYLGVCGIPFTVSASFRMIGRVDGKQAIVSFPKRLLDKIKTFRNV